MLQAVAAKEKKPIGSYGFILAGCLLGAALIVGGVYIALNITNNGLVSQTEVINAEINSPEIQDRLTTLNNKITRLGNISQYSDNIKEAKLLFDFQPTIITEITEKLEENLVDGMYIDGDVSVSGYNVSVNFVCDDQSQPAEYVRLLNEQGYFENIHYNGFTGTSSDEDDDDATYSFSLSMLLKGGNAYEAE